MREVIDNPRIETADAPLAVCSTLIRRLVPKT